MSIWFLPAIYLRTKNWHCTAGYCGTRLRSRTLSLSLENLGRWRTEYATAAWPSGFYTVSIYWRCHMKHERGVMKESVVCTFHIIERQWMLMKQITAQLVVREEIRAPTSIIACHYMSLHATGDIWWLPWWSCPVNDVCCLWIKHQLTPSHSDNYI